MTILNRIHRILREGTVVQFPRKNQQSFKPGDVVFHDNLKGPHVFHGIVKGKDGDVAHVYPLGMKMDNDVTTNPSGFNGFKRVDKDGLRKASR